MASFESMSFCNLRVDFCLYVVKFQHLVNANK